MADTTEPAIPVLAALPIPAHRDLTDLVEAEMTRLGHAQALVKVEVTEDRRAILTAVARIYDNDHNEIDVGGALTYTGRRWAGGGFIRWTRKN
jgi:hypothetical protein